MNEQESNQPHAEGHVQVGVCRPEQMHRLQLVMFRRFGRRLGARTATHRLGSLSNGDKAVRLGRRTVNFGVGHGNCSDARKQGHVIRRQDEDEDGGE